MPEWLPLYAVLWGLRWLEFVVRRPAGAVVITGRGARRGKARSVPSPAGTDRGDFVLVPPLRSPDIFLSGSASQSRLSVEEVEERLADYRGETAVLRRAEAALGIQLFIVVPLVWITIGLARSWPYLLLGVLALQTWTIAAFVLAHGRLSGSGAADRWMAALPLILSPPAATVSHLALTKRLFDRSHPVAVAAVLCNDGAFPALALIYLRRATFPLGGATESDDPAETPAALRDDLRRLIESRVGIAALLRTPSERNSEAAQAYCPRCLGEFSQAGGSCPECHGVRLMEFDEPRIRPGAPGS